MATDKPLLDYHATWIDPCRSPYKGAKHVSDNRERKSRCEPRRDRSSFACGGTDAGVHSRPTAKNVGRETIPVSLTRTNGTEVH